MSVTNVGSLSPERLNEASLGPVESELSVMESIALVRRDITDLKGSAPYFPTDGGVGHDRNRDLPEGVEATPTARQIAEVEYDCKRQVGFERIPNATQIRLDSLSIDTLGMHVAAARRQANTNVDIKGELVLKDETVNTVYDAISDGGGAWSDEGVASEPYLNIQEILDNHPGLDTFVFGPGVRRALQKNAHTRAEIGRKFNAGMARQDQIEALIRALYPQIERVIMVRKRINTAGDGVDPSYRWLFDDFAWIGRQEDLQFFDPNHPLNPYIDQDKNIRAEALELIHSRRIDIKRVRLDCGVYVKRILG